MPKSTQRKNHKKKLAQRRTKMDQEKKRVDKLKREWINQLIKHEQERGMFDDNQNIDLNKTLEGPQI